MKTKESPQRQIMKSLESISNKKSSDHRAHLRNAGLAITNVILDGRIPLHIVQQDLEDLRETVDMAINIIDIALSSEGKKSTQASSSVH